MLVPCGLVRDQLRDQVREYEQRLTDMRELASRQAHDISSLRNVAERTLQAKVAAAGTRDQLMDGTDVVKVDFANPHVVVKDFSGYFQDFAEKLQADVKHFPDSVNVEFVESFSAEGLVSARIFERGVGETMACGSGALVLAVDAWRTGFEGEICVKTWGGELYLSQVSLNSILLRGEARVTGKVRLELA